MDHNYYGNSTGGFEADEPELPSMNIADEIVLPIYNWLSPLVARGEQVGNLDMTKAKAFVDEVKSILEDDNG